MSRSCYPRHAEAPRHGLALTDKPPLKAGRSPVGGELIPRVYRPSWYWCHTLIKHVIDWERKLTTPHFSFVISSTSIRLYPCRKDAWCHVYNVIYFCTSTISFSSSMVSCCLWDPLTDCWPDACASSFVVMTNNWGNLLEGPCIVLFWNFRVLHTVTSCLVLS